MRSTPRSTSRAPRASWAASRAGRTSGRRGGSRGGPSSPASGSSPCCPTPASGTSRCRSSVRRLRGMFGLGTAARVAKEVTRDVRAARDRDPAARGVGRTEILATWPGVQALLAHRLAHVLHDAGVPVVPRTVATVMRAATGIEIHPAAQIGPGLFTDHGSGVVIGETAEIGEDVTLYQGVTLGGTGFATGKRHPTIEDNVTIGSGAKLLGPINIGHGAKIGANSVVIHDVPPNSTVVGNPGHPVRVEGRKPEGPDADWAHLPDPGAPTPTGRICRTRSPTRSARCRRACASSRSRSRSTPAASPRSAGRSGRCVP